MLGAEELAAPDPREETSAIQFQPLVSGRNVGPVRPGLKSFPKEGLPWRSSG